jgi:hypothetical protein
LGGAAARQSPSPWVRPWFKGIYENASLNLHCFNLIWHEIYRNQHFVFMLK